MAGTRKARVPMAEQIRLINECRQSGMTDADWCRENDIAVSTFYNWIRYHHRIMVILKLLARNRTWFPLTLCRITFRSSMQPHRCKNRILTIHI